MSKRRTLGSVRRNRAPERQPFPGMLPRCCPRHRLPELDDLSWIIAVDAWHTFAVARSMGWGAEDLQNLADGKARYLAGRIDEAIGFALELWLLLREDEL
jgi:hypothetical protein